MSYNENSYTVSGDTDSIHSSLVGWYSERTSISEDLMSKEQIEARVLELYKNNDTMRSLIDKHVDAIVGSKVSLESLIDYEALNISREDAVEWSKTVESEFNNYAHSPENWISATRSMSFTELMRACAKQEIMTGEVFVAKEWYQSPLGYKTCFNVISSHRVKSPVDYNGTIQDASKIFHGIQLDKRGA